MLIHFLVIAGRRPASSQNWYSYAKDHKTGPRIVKGVDSIAVKFGIGRLNRTVVNMGGDPLHGDLASVGGLKDCAIRLMHCNWRTVMGVFST